MSTTAIKYDDICDKCAHASYCDMATFGGHNPRITACSHYKSKTQTNGDRIRAMTDEELAEFLHKNRGGCRALTTESYVCDFYTEDLNTDCKACWLDWLKQEATE